MPDGINVWHPDSAKDPPKDDGVDIAGEAGLGDRCSDVLVEGSSAAVLCTVPPTAGALVRVTIAERIAACYTFDQGTRLITFLRVR